MLLIQPTVKFASCTSLRVYKSGNWTLIFVKRLSNVIFHMKKLFPLQIGTIISSNKGTQRLLLALENLLMRCVIFGDFLLSRVFLFIFHSKNILGLEGLTHRLGLLKKEVVVTS